MLSGDSSSSGLTVMMVILAFVCAATAILVLLYYRKRVRNLKREIAHVHYTADPSSQPGTSLYIALGLSVSIRNHTYAKD